MKVPHSFTYNRLVSHLRIAGAVTLLSAAAAKALVAEKPSSTTNVPDVLTFSGAAYTTSGRITALAVDPACSNSRCRAWAAAAGGGVWRTDNALSGSGVNWTFVSNSFATNAIGTLTYDAAH